MTKRILIALFAAVLVATVSYADTGSIAGNTVSAVKVQLRSVDTGQLAGSTQSAADGGFSFTGVNAGNYVVEIIDASGKIIGTSSSMSLAAGGVISGVTVTASSALAQAAAAGGGGSFFTSTAGILVLVGIGVGATWGIIAATNDGSPSK